MDSKLKTGAEHYYPKSENLKQLYYENNDISGAFLYDQLTIKAQETGDPYDRIPQEFKEFYNEIEKSVKTMDKDKLHQPISAWSELPQIFKEIMVYIHIIFHESMHILQTFTLQACNEHVYQHRKLLDIDIAIFYLHIKYGYTWKFGDRILNNQASKWIMEKEPWIEKRYRTSMNFRKTLRHQFSESRSKQLNTIDLVEGEAFAYQELVTDTIGRFSTHLKSTSVYKKALLYFLPKKINSTQIQEKIYTLFILFCHLSLKFGTSRYRDFNTTAVAIFLHLCTEKEKFIMMFSKRSYDDKFQDQQFSWLINNEYKKMNKSHIKVFLNISYIIDSIEKEILRYFRIMVYNSTYFLGKEKDFYSSTHQSYDRKMKPLFSYYKMANKGFDSKYFIALLLSGNKEISQDYVESSFDDKIYSIPVKTPTGKEFLMEQDNYLFETLFDLKNFIKKGEAYCCIKHQYSNQKSIITSCTEPMSLRMKIKEFFGSHIELSEIVHQ